MDPSQQARPLLHTACLLGDEENVVKIICAGADMNEVDFAGCSAIQLASASGHLNVVKLLLQNGAKPEIQDATHGNTCLHESSWRGFSSLVKLLSNPSTINLQNHGGFSSLHLACQAGHNQSTRELLVAGANPNLVNTYGDTPLHTSVRYGHAGVCRILLSARAEANVQNKNGDTALHISSAMHRKKLTKILLSAGCSSNLVNNQGETPLDICQRKNFEDVVHVLKNPPNILTPMQRDEMRASKFKVSATVHTHSKQQQPQPSTSTSALVQFPLAKPTSTTTLRQQVVALLTNKTGSRKSIAAAGTGGSKDQSQSITKVAQPLDSKGSSSNSKSHHQKLFKSSNRNGSQNDLKGSKNNSATNLSSEKRDGNNGTSSVAVIENKESENNNKEIVEGEDVPKWSPYGCHYHPNTGSFPKPNIDSLPKEPLTTGELYYLDLAGNIHKGPMGVSEGCYCNTLLSQNQNSQSMMALNGNNNKAKKPSSKHHHGHQHNHHHHHHRQNSKHDLQQEQNHNHHEPKSAINPTIAKVSKYEDQLKSLTTQLSKIHLDTQAQLSSLHTMLHERLKDGSNRHHSRQHADINGTSKSTDGQVDGGGDDDGENEFNENQLKDWVKQYRRFRKEIAKNPKTLHQANELLASASALLSTRLQTPPPPDSETDSGL